LKPRYGLYIIEVTQKWSIMCLTW